MDKSQSHSQSFHILILTARIKVLNPYQYSNHKKKIAKKVVKKKSIPIEKSENIVDSV